MKRLLTVVAAAVLSVTAVGCAKTELQANQATEPVSGVLQAQKPQKGEEIAIITTNYGEMRMQFYPEEAPKAVENFKTHAKEGYYDGLTFHRVIEDFMIQTGDPTGTGSGGESIWGKAFEDEISPKLHFFRGAVAMANAGPNTNGSQFFVVQAPKVNEDTMKILQDAKESEDDLKIKIGEDQVVSLKDIFTDEVMEYYQKQGGTVELEYAFGSPYTIFGQVYDGFDTIDAIAKVETGEADKPLEDVVIQSIQIEPYKE